MIRYILCSSFAIILCGFASAIPMPPPPPSQVVFVTSTADTYSPGELRYEIENAAFGDTVLIDVAGTCSLSARINVNANVVIIGPEPIHSTIDGSGIGAASIFNTGGSFNVSLYGVSLVNASVPWFNMEGPEEIKLKNCVIKNNSYSPLTSVVIAEGFYEIEACSFYSNTSASNGGAIQMAGGALISTNCTFYNNEVTSGFSGGAIYYNGINPLEITSNTFYNNGMTTVANGAAISNASNTSITLQNNIFYNNPTNPNIVSGSNYTSNGGNFINVNSPPFGFFMNVVGSSMDPMLETSIVDGFGLEYFPLQAGSPCIDIGNSTGLIKYDARRVWRDMQASASAEIADAGAVEFSPYTVYNTNGTGAGSFENAVNNIIGFGYPGNKAIVFEIPGSGPYNANVLNTQTIDEANLIINGFSQNTSRVPGPENNSGNLITGYTPIRFTGSGSSDFLDIQSGSDSLIVAGISITNYYNGILTYAQDNFIEGCHIGVADGGYMAVPNSFGISVPSGGLGNIRIGAGQYLWSNPRQTRNVISGNSSAQIELTDCGGHIISSNFIGLSANGLDVPTSTTTGAKGIYLRVTTPSAFSQSLIGGYDFYDENIICGQAAAIHCELPYIEVAYNFIGANYWGGAPSNMATCANGTGIIVSGVDSYFNWIEGNIIVNTDNIGLNLTNGSQNNTVVYNYFGLAEDGLTAIFNKGDGILVDFDSQFNTIGGLNTEDGNFIANSDFAGIIYDNMTIPSNDSIIGNYIGLDTSFMPAANATGIEIRDNTQDVYIGDIQAGFGNEIAYNTGLGIKVLNSTGTKGIRISGNSMFNNGGLGIDLDNNGPSLTTATAPISNNGMIPPNLLSLSDCPGDPASTVKFSVDLPISMTYQIEFFHGDSDGEEGADYIENVIITPTTQPQTFSHMLTSIPLLGAGDYITATATDVTNKHTSEFSDTVLYNVSTVTAIDQTGSYCSDTPGGNTHTVDLITDFDALVNGGSGYPVSWYGDAACTSMLATPGAYPGFNTQIVYAVVDGGVCTDTATVTVIINSSPDVSTYNPLFNDVTCNGMCDGNATYFGPMGSGETYDFGDGSGPLLTNNSNPLCAGSYTLIHVDINGCSGTDTYTIYEPSAVSVVETSTDATCFGICDGTLSATPTGGTLPYVFNWDNGIGTSQYPTGICAGIYTVTVTDANGCTAVGSGVNVNEPSAVVATISGFVDVSCYGGGDGQATVLGSGGVGGPYFYQWDAATGNQTTATASGLLTGTYWVDVTDGNGCVGSNTVTINEPPQLTVFDVVDNQVSCFGLSDGQATVTPSGGTAPYTYVWSPVPGGGQGTITATGLAAGTYNCTVTDNNSCSAVSAPINITEPSSINISTVTTSNTTCFLSADGTATINTPTGGVSPYNYQWYDNSGPTLITGETTLTATGLDGGDFYCEVTDANGCIQNSGLGTVIEPTNLIVTITPSSTSICPNGSLTLTGSSSGGTTPYSEVWDNGVSNGVPFNGPSASTTYTFTTTDGNGCITTDNITITMDPLPTALDQSGTYCSDTPGGATATVDLAADFNSLINGGSGDPVTWYNDAGLTSFIATPTSYTAIDGETLYAFVTGASCSDTAVVTITVTPSPGASANLDATVCANNAATTLAGSITDATGGLWVTSGSGLFSPSATVLNAVYNPSPADISAGNVTLTLSSTGNGSCTAATDDMIIYINPAPTVYAGADTTICSGATLNLNASFTVASGVSWSGGSGTFTPSNTVANPTYNPSAGEMLGGVVTLTVTTTGNGSCLPEADDIILTISAPPSTSTITGPTNVCVNSVGVVYSVSPTGGSSYVWSTPTGSIITSGQGTDNINLDFSANSGTVSVTETNAAGCVGSPSSLSVVVNALPTVTSSPDATLCDGSTTTLSGAGAVSYSWDNGVIDGVSFTPPLGSTIYTVTGTDANGCEGTSTTTLTVNTSPSISHVFTNLTCAGANDGTITVTTSGGSAPYTYSNDGGATYSAGSDPYTFTGLLATTYSIYVQDGNGCISNNITENISEPTPLAFDSIQVVNESCGASNGTIEVFGATGGTPIYDYSIDGGATYQAASLFASLPAGSYPILLQDQNGCQLNLGTTTVSSAPPIVITTSTFTNVSCNGLSDGLVSSNTATGGSGSYTYQWYNTSTGSLSGQTGLTANGLPAGDYFIEANDGACIQNSDTVSIIEPAAIVTNITPSNPTCFGDTDGSILIEVISGGTAPFTFSDDNGTSFNVGTSPYTFGETAGSYDIVVQDNNGCLTTPQNVVIIDPSQLTLSLTVINESCFGAADGSIDHLVSGGAGFPYDLNYNGTGSFTMGSNPQMLGGLTDGYTHSVVVTDANGCTDTATASITGPAQITFNTALVDDTCSQGVGQIQISSVTGGTGGPYGYSIDNGSTIVTSNVINVVPGTYNLIVGDANGCVQVATGLVINDIAGSLNFAGVNGPYTICPGEFQFISAYGGSSYNWLTAGVSDPFNDSTEVKPDSTTIYVVEISSGGCMKLDSTMVIVDATGCAIGEIANNVFSPDGDNVNDSFIIDIPFLLQNENNVKIYNRWGDLINEFANYNNDDQVWDGTNMDGSYVTEGTYFYVVEIPSINYSNSGWVQVER